MTVLAVTGLKREARIAGRAGVVAVAGGGDAASLKAKLEALHGDIKGVISVGLAGALSPLLKVGDVVIGESVQVCHPRAPWRAGGGGGRSWLSSQRRPEGGNNPLFRRLAHRPGGKAAARASGAGRGQHSDHRDGQGQGGTL